MSVRVNHLRVLLVSEFIADAPNNPCAAHAGNVGEEVIAFVLNLLHHAYTLPFTVLPLKPFTTSEAKAYFDESGSHAAGGCVAKATFHFASMCGALFETLICKEFATGNSCGTIIKFDFDKPMRLVAVAAGSADCFVSGHA